MDLILLLLVVIFAMNGYRQGFVIGLLSFVGFFGGAALGLQFGPPLANQFTNPVARLVVSLVAVFGAALTGQAIASWLGIRIRRGIRGRAGQAIDDTGGALVSVVALLLVAWLVAGPLGSSSMPGLAKAVRSSEVLHGVNALMPQQAQALSNALRTTVDTDGFPNVFGDLIPTNVRQVPAPNPALRNNAVVLAAHESVVKVEGSAPSCDRRIEGSGFVIGPERVLTNAHVVAGTGSLTVQTEHGTMSGKVVVFDPERDLAVIDVPGLSLPALPFARGQAKTDADSIVLGYPLDGPYDAEPSRIRDVSDISGPDIYNTRTVTRDIYTIRGLVRSGNSGGPLISSNGDVLGIVFAAAADNQQVGFALTASEAAPIVAAGDDHRSPGQYRFLHGLGRAFARRQVGQLDHPGTVATIDVRGPSRRQLLRPDRTDQHALVPIAGEHEPRRGEFAESRDHRLEQCTGRAAGAPGDDQVQPDVPRLSQIFEQRRERVRSAGDQVVVVDEHEALRSFVPGTVAQLPRCHVRSGQAPLHVLGDRGEQRGGLAGRGRVPDQVVALDLAEHRPPVVDDDQPRLFRRVAGDDRGGDRPERGRLAAAGFAEDQEVRIGREVDRDDGQVGLRRCRAETRPTGRR